MEDPIFDGKCHALSKYFGYIAKRFHGAFGEKLEDHDIEEHLIEFCEYLFKNDKNKVISYLMQIFTDQVKKGKTDENYSLILRPPWVISCLAQEGTLALKFKRAEGDGLDDT